MGSLLLNNKGGFVQSMQEQTATCQRSCTSPERIQSVCLIATHSRHTRPPYRIKTLEESSKDGPLKGLSTPKATAALSL